MTNTATSINDLISVMRGQRDRAMDELARAEINLLAARRTIEEMKQGMADRDAIIESLRGAQRDLPRGNLVEPEPVQNGTIQ